MKKTVRVVLATLSARYIHASYAPFCLLSGLRTFSRHPHTATVIEGTINEETEAVLSRILAERPTLLALSVYIWNRRETVSLVRAVRAAMPSLIIVAGGPEAEHDAAAFLHECPIDAVLTGEGERGIALLADALAEERELCSVPGAVTRAGSLPPAPPELCPPSAVTPEYLAAVRGRIAYLETSRGCPFSCAFCLSGQEGGGRFYPVERAKAEMLALAGAGARTVKLIDRTFNADRERARELWRFVIAEQGRGIPRGVSFHFEVAGDLLTEEDLALLSTAPAGAIRLEIGIQSFYPKTLAAISRRGDPDRLAERIAALTALGTVEVHIDLIAGLPHEDLATFLAGVDRAFALAPSMLQLGFLKLLHGSAMRQNPEAYPCTFSKTPPYEVTSTPVLSSEELEILHALEGALDHLYNSHRFSRALSYLTGPCGIRPSELFAEFGRTVPAHGMSLDAYTDAFFRYASSLPSVDFRILRDCLLADRLATTPDRALPKCLYVEDKRLSRVKKTMQDALRASGRSIPFSVGILYATGEVICAEYTERHPITGEYPTKIQKLF